MERNINEDEAIITSLEKEQVIITNDILEEEYVEKLKELEKKLKNDNEELHYMYDECILDFLESKGYIKIVKQYRETNDRNIFWYA